MEPNEIKLEPDRIYETKELCKLLKISEVTARKYLRTGMIAGNKAGKSWKMLGKNIIKYLNPSTK